MQNSLSCTPILLLLEGKRGCFAWWLWPYGNAKVALLQHKQAGFVVLFLACSACWLCNILVVRRLSITAQNSRISHQRFCCALSEEYWALEMQISYLDMRYMFLDMKTWGTCFLDMKTWGTCFLDMKTWGTCFLDKIFELCAKAHCELFSFELIGRIQPIQNSDWLAGLWQKHSSTVRLWVQTLSGLNKRLYIRSYENQFSTTWRKAFYLCKARTHNRKKQKKHKATLCNLCFVCDILPINMVN